MARAVKQREGKPFAIFLALLLIGSLWNAAGGDIDAFTRIWNGISQEPKELEGKQATIFDQISMRFQHALGIPQPVVFPQPKVISHLEDLAEATKASEQEPGTRPILATLSDKPNAFFPQWVQDLIPKDGEAVPTVGPTPPVVTANRREDLYVFTGIVKLKTEPPMAVLRDMQKNVSVFLKEKDTYGPILAKEVKLDGATFQVGVSRIFRFDTLRFTDKTIRIARQIERAQ